MITDRHKSHLFLSYRFPLTRYELITAVSFKNCASKNAMCEKLICNNDYSPACGNDAITYTNLCHLQKATCMTGIQLAHAGQCVKNPHKKEENCPKNCDKAENKIVCGSDGNAYRFLIYFFFSAGERITDFANSTRTVFENQPKRSHFNFGISANFCSQN